MIRNPNPNRELDRDPYWSFNEEALLDIIKVRQGAQYFHQSKDQCPNCGANCWEAEEPPIVFRGCACGTMAFPPGVPLHERWSPELWAQTVSEARRELLRALKAEFELAGGGPN